MKESTEETGSALQPNAMTAPVTGGGIFDGKGWHRFLSLLTMVLAGGCLLAVEGRADPLDQEITIISSETRILSNDISSAIEDIKDQTNLSKSALLVGDIMDASPGDTIVWPISLVPGVTFPTALQADIVIPSSFTFVSIMAGPAATLAGKQISSSSVAGNRRFIIFGLNQTVIGGGEVALVTFKISSASPKKQYSIGLINPSTSDANGNAVTTSLVSGTVIL